MAEKSLTTVDFHGAKLIALRGDTPAETLVAMKPVVEGMGLDWKGQYDKIKGHPVLNTCVGVIPIQMPGDDQRRDVFMMPLNRLNFWLATIQPERVPNEATRAKVIAYQTECADVLFDHFFARANDVLTPTLCRDIRTMLGLTRDQLAVLAGFSRNTILLFEGDRMVLSRDDQTTLRRALDLAASQVRKAAKPRQILPKAPPPPIEPTVRLQFTVPVTVSARICAYVTKMTKAPTAGKGE
jgi:DNA-binding XRE family transcriptional regulator